MSIGERGTAVGEPVELREHERGGTTATSIAAVSTMSWLVAPSGRSRRFRPRPRPGARGTSGSAVPGRAAVVREPRGVVELGAAGFSDPGSGVLGDEADRGARPGERARSASSIPCSHARSETASRSSCGTKMAENGVTPRRTSSAGALEDDVEAKPAVPRARDEGRALLRLEPEEHRVLRVRRLLVGEVHAGRDALEEAAGEDPDEQVRRLEPAVHPRHATGLHRDELEPAAVLGARAPEAGEAALERDLLAIVGRVRVAAGRVRLPDLDQAVRHGPPAPSRRRPRCGARADRTRRRGGSRSGRRAVRSSGTARWSATG